MGKSTMSTPEFTYQKPFPTGQDSTQYRLLSKDHVSVKEFNGQPVLVVEPSGNRENVRLKRDVSIGLRSGGGEPVTSES